MGRRARASANSIRRLLVELAKARELARLAERAGCSIDEAAQRRSEGERYCLGCAAWYRQNRCMRCKARKQRDRRRARAALRRECE